MLNLLLSDVSTAAIVLLMSISAPSMMDQSLLEKARDAWKEATSVLESMSTFCRSATNTLQFLQAAYARAVPTGRQQTGVEADASQIPQPNDQSDQSCSWLSWTIKREALVILNCCPMSALRRFPCIFRPLSAIPSTITNNLSKYDLIKSRNGDFRLVLSCWGIQETFSFITAVSALGERLGNMLGS